MAKSKISPALTMLSVISAGAFLAAFAPTPNKFSQETDSHIVAPSENADPENTDRTSQEPTADQAGQNEIDLDIMQKIRRAVVEDKSLSTYAHNVKIISQFGKVTLEGPVNTQAESQDIEAKAIAVAGAANVNNRLSVESSDATR